MNTMMQPLYDKALSRGIASLSDEELLTLLVEEPGVAASVLRSCGGSLASVAAEEPARLRMVGGLGRNRALRLLAAAEFGRRVAESRAGEADVIATSDDVVHLFRPKLQRLDHEECWVLYLTSSNRIVERQRVSQGGVQGTVVDHRLIIKRALELLATQLIMVHNHPSGAAEPSPQDKVLTERIARAAALFDIRLLDHLIISREGDFSFLCEGLLH
jgi:DNA repair protein RadC